MQIMILQTVVCFLSASMFVLLSGCSPPSTSLNTLTEPLFRQQLQQVIAGESNSIEVTERVVSPAELQLLSRAEKLQRIRLDQTPLDDQSAAVLGALPELQFVNLPHAQITDAGLAELAKLPQLTQLRIGSPLLTDAGIAALRDNKSLRFLHILQTPLTDKSLEHIAEIQSLESFYLDQTNITEGGLANLIEQRPQLHVHFDDAHLPGQEH